MIADEYDFWLLDLDGTLVDVRPGYVREVFDAVGDRMGRPFSDREADVIWHGLSGSRDEVLREWGIDPGRFWTHFHEVEDATARAEATYLHEDAAFVADLDAPTGVVTHCQRYLTCPVLDHLDIRDWFDTVVCCSEDLGWKPDPAPVRHAMADLGVGYNGHEGVLAGDSPSDIGAAWNTGLDAIHVERHDPARRGHCVRGDYRIGSFADLG